MACLHQIVALKALAFLGVWLTAGGTVLLWRSSPSGYALSGYGGDTVVQENNRNNRHMGKSQRVAIALIMAGAALQVPLIIWG